MEDGNFKKELDAQREAHAKDFHLAQAIMAVHLNEAAWNFARDPENIDESPPSWMRFQSKTFDELLQIVANGLNVHDENYSSHAASDLSSR